LADIAIDLAWQHLMPPIQVSRSELGPGLRPVEAAELPLEIRLLRRACRRCNETRNDASFLLSVTPARNGREVGDMAQASKRIFVNLL